MGIEAKDTTLILKTNSKIEEELNKEKTANNFSSIKNIETITMNIIHNCKKPLDLKTNIEAYDYKYPI